MHDGPNSTLVTSPCGINGDVSRDTPALAFGITVPFSRSRCPTPHRPDHRGVPCGRSASAEPTLTSASTTPACGAGSEGRPCQSTRKSVLRADWRYYGLRVPSASRGGRFLVTVRLFSPPMGSSGSKKTRKGKPRQHLPKVGTPAENAHTHARGRARRRGQLGVHGQGRGCSGSPSW